MLFVSEQEVIRALIPETAIAALLAAFRGNIIETVNMPTRTQHDLSPDHVLLTMPCYSADMRHFGVKLVTVSKRQDRLSEVNAVFMLYEPTSSQVEAVIEANYLTDVRTAAVSAIATDILALPHAEILGIFGTGRQANAHARVLPGIRRFSQTLVCGSTRDKAEAFAASLQPELKMPVVPADAEECARRSDVICTCTNSVSPLFDGSWLRPGTHLNLVGGYRPTMREVDDVAIERSVVVVDTFDGALAEAGEILIPLQAGKITADYVRADLHGVVSGAVQVRRSDQEITLFKSVGCALEDLAVAEAVYQRVLERLGAEQML